MIVKFKSATKYLAVVLMAAIPTAYAGLPSVSLSKHTLSNVGAVGGRQVAISLSRQLWTLKFSSAIEDKNFDVGVSKVLSTDDIRNLSVSNSKRQSVTPKVINDGPFLKGYSCETPGSCVKSNDRYACNTLTC